MKLLMALIFVSSAALAKIEALDAHVRLMPPGFSSTAGFVILKNSGSEDVELVSAKADFAKKIELHTHKVEEGVMKMRKVEKMIVPAKGQLVLKPHSDHLMIFGVEEELKPGQKKKIDLKFSKGQKLGVQFKVRDLNK